MQATPELTLVMKSKSLSFGNTFQSNSEIIGLHPSNGDLLELTEGT